MAVYRLDLAYEGTDYRGYARQPGMRTVQGELEAALAVLVGDVETAVAGRTDAGVHARGQVVSFATDRDLDPVGTRRSLDSMTPPDLAVTAVTRAGDGFHARFSATARCYRYHVLDREAPDPLRRRHVWHIGEGPLDLPAMNRAAEAMVGEHDFASFCRKAEGKTTVRTVTAATWERAGDLAVFAIRATAFCHQMVRSIVAVCVAAGRGRLDPDVVPSILFARDRNAARGAAPPHGLVLWEVDYGPEDAP